ncbi:MAG: 8-oxo-dGTP diphosphatase [Actinobacteria bacterium]|jgi:8-oxo-dGTP diphosphatase|nr:8-oxo-dGTP diphosphatase [Actinomycetota bacterium]
MESENPVIYAAGAVLWRFGAKKRVEIALIHRPRYGDWSLPKGKLDANETMIGCAYREVMEETGHAAIFGPEIGDATYVVDGVTKLVKYWSAQAVGEPTGKPNPTEIDQILWLSPAEARKKLTLDDDRSIVDFFLEFGTGTTALVLLRHAKAIKREDWDGDDGDRPLGNVGQLQAKRLLSKYLPYAIKEVHSSDAMRCIETIEPMTRALQMHPIFSTDLSEYRFAKDKEVALDYAQDLMLRNQSAIICSHNPILPKVLKKLIGKKNFKELDQKLEPAEAWVLHHRDGEIIAIDWVSAPNT